MPTSVSKWDCIDISVAVLLSSCVNLPLVSKIKCMKFKGKKAPPVMKYVYVYVLRKYPFWNVQLPLGSSGQDLDGASARTSVLKSAGHLEHL